MTSRPTNPDENKAPEELEREIDQTRARMSRTVDELESRLSPGQVIDQGMSYMREHGHDIADSLGTSFKQNPLPLLLTGIGLAWMMSSSRPPSAGPSTDTLRDYAGRASQRSGSAGGRMSSAGSAVGERMSAAGDSAKSTAQSAREAAQSARDSVSHGADSMRRRADDMRGSMQSQAGEMRDGFSRLMQEQPFVPGAIAVALGAALAAALPPTRQEDELIGRKADAAREQAKGMAAEGYEQARDTAKQAAAGAKEATRSESSSRDRSEPSTPDRPAGSGAGATGTPGTAGTTGTTGAGTLGS